MEQNLFKRMHATLESAKKYCERKRDYGNVFYISPYPVLLIKCNDKKFFAITEMETFRPLANYLSSKIYEIEALENSFLFTEESYFYHNVSASKLLKSFKNGAEFWKKGRISPHLCIFEVPDFNGIERAFSTIDDEKKYEDWPVFESCSAGSNYYLQWYEMDIEHKQYKINEIFRLYEDFKYPWS
ncbi:hypothetical protein [Neisseria iguanae]|uniref:Uncharacterized protein n=1 Tax=Neisseria iguanae TaxID=90242 RepID=A0A2P7TYQ7_9NEIS|nr:hypothetical protein [Neisseria iguanae]PSJ79864.1 hypothetical protein C7N83_09690 [Neisseria iguanae]